MPLASTRQIATPLAVELRRKLREAPARPVTVHDFMAACVAQYYSAGPVFGRDGDFVTAPEISQVFGEVIGLWCAVVWQQMGSPDAFNLVELGPGRGTMMRDALRALRLVPDCLAAARVHLIEPSAHLRAVQAGTLAGASAGPAPAVQWCAGLADIAAAPTIVVGNEYVDTLPVHQFVRHEGGWRTRCVALGPGDDQLAFAAGPPFDAATTPADLTRHLEGMAPDSADGDIVEWRDIGPDLATIGRLRDSGLALLLIDYGHARSAIGDTLQAVRRHAFEQPLQAVGAADLTAQVDFAALRRQLVANGWRVPASVLQSAFLASLGATERAARLMAANPQAANAVEMAVGRLMSPSGMGARFQVLGARSPHLPPLPGLSQ